jgi:hypothetical protein
MSILGVTGIRNLRHSVASYSPRWLANRLGLTVGAKVLYTLAAVLDIMLEVENQGLYAQLPGLGTNTALPYIGFSRGIMRGFAESDLSYSNRLIQWLDLWRGAGRPVGMLLAVLGLFSPVSLTVRVVDNSGNWYWYNLGQTPMPPGATTPLPPNVLLQQGNWNWDGNAASWWRMWVIVYVGPLSWTVGSAGPHWGDGGHWGDAGRLWGITGATAGQIQALRVLVKQWKAAHVWVPNIILTANTARFDPTHAAGGGVNPDGTWGNPANRFTDCVFLDGAI